MCERRTSSRARKQIDYSVAGENNFKEEDDDDDEDFAISRGPPAKKLRTAKEKTMDKTNAKNLEQTSSSKSNNRTSKERLFERDLEHAMSLSKPFSSSDLKGIQLKPVSVNIQITDVKVSKSTGSAAEKETKSAPPESNLMEEIQKETEGVMASIKRDESQLNDDDVLSDHLSPSDAESSEDDEGGSNSDSSFDSRQGRRTKTQALNKKTAKAKPSAKPTKSAKPAVEKLNKSKTVSPANLASSSKKTISRSNLPRERVDHAKVASSSKQFSYGSPSSGVLRIGLSRNVKVKPLHQLHSPTSNSIKS